MTLDSWAADLGPSDAVDAVLPRRLRIAAVLTFSLLACGSERQGVVADNGSATGGQQDASSRAAGGAVDAASGTLGPHAAPISDAGVSVVGAAGSCAARVVQAEVMTEVEPADIIVAIDTSSSMDDEIALVQAEMNRFSQQIGSSGIDVRVILIGEAAAICIGAPLGSGSCPDDTRLPGYVHVDRKVYSHTSLRAIVNSYRDWSPHLRPAASKSFVIITDDEATNDAGVDPGEEFSTKLLARDPALFARWSFNGIFVQQECELGKNIGEVYRALVAQTGGVSGDLCQQDFQPVFDRLSQKIIRTSTVGIDCDWSIPAPPPGEELDFGSVNVRYTDAAGAVVALGKVPSSAECSSFRNGWYYDDAQKPSAIVACPQSCAQLKAADVARIDVLFGCKSETPPLL